ncbi:MAG: hypothetical protein EOO04_30885, partial [Chitinophagaceae bacterium]
LGEKQDPVSMYLADIFTVQASLAGVPAISASCPKNKTVIAIISCCMYKCKSFAVVLFILTGKRIFATL